MDSSNETNLNAPNTVQWQINRYGDLFLNMIDNMWIRINLPCITNNWVPEQWNGLIKNMENNKEFCQNINTCFTSGNPILESIILNFRHCRASCCMRSPIPLICRLFRDEWVRLHPCLHQIIIHPDLENDIKNNIEMYISLKESNGGIISYTENYIDLYHKIHTLDNRILKGFVIHKSVYVGNKNKIIGITSKLHIKEEYIKNKSFNYSQLDTY